MSKNASRELELEPEPASIITGSLEGETPGEPETGTPDTTGESQTATGAEEELENSSEEESPLEELAAAPLASTPAITPKTGELHPQETKTEYESAASATTAAEADTTARLLMVIKAPSALDAAGSTVPATISVTANKITMTLIPSESTTFPVTAAIAATGGTAASAPPEVHYGLSDHKPESFEKAEETPGTITAGFDKHLLETGPLHVKVARDFIPYNATPAQFAGLIAWLKAVTAVGLEPYVTFESPKECLLKGKRKICPAGSDPSIETYGKDIKRLILNTESEATVDKLTPVTVWGAWNEPDLHSKSTANALYEEEEKAALFWKKARQILTTACVGCTMVAGEFAEYDGYSNRYQSIIKNDRKFWPHMPAVWGLHDYKDLSEANAQQPDYAKKLKRFVKSVTRRWTHARIWVSEAGVELQNNFEATRLAKAANTLELQRLAAEDFLHLHTVSERYIEVIDYYQYFGPSAGELAENRTDFDSGLHHGTGTPAEAQEPREAYCVIALAEDGCLQTKTEPAEPGATTSTSTTAMLTLDPSGLPSDYFVEYGTTTAYGHTTSPTAVVNDTGKQSESVNLSGLEPCTTYHYQAEAENEDSEDGAALGGDKTFQTGGCGPWVRTGSAIATYEEAFESDEHTYELTGEVNPKGSATSYYFEYGPTRANGYSTPVESAGSGSEYSEVAAHAIFTYIFHFGEEVEDVESETSKEEEEEKEQEEREAKDDFARPLFFHPDLILCLKAWHYRLVGVNSSGINYGVERRIVPCI